MPYTRDYLSMELSAIRKEIDNQNFERADILSNRIMSNAFILNAHYYGVVGFLIKDLILLAMPKESIKNNPVSNISSNLKLFLDEISKLSFVNNGNSELWKIYYKTLTTIRMNLTDDKDIYNKDNIALTTEGVTFLLNYVKDKKDLITQPYNSLFEILLTEINRLYSAYGISLEDCKVRITIILIFLIDNYLKKITDPILSHKYLTDVVMSNFEELLKIKENNSDHLIEPLINKLVLLWRQFYLILGEPSKTSVKQEQQLNLPQDLRTKLTDLVSTSIQDHIKRIR